MADLWTPRGLKNVEKGPNKSESKKNLLFRGTPIEQDEPELSASFYAEQNPAEQAQPHPYQSFVFRDYQSPVIFDIKPNPVGPIMTSIPMAQTQVVADKAKEYRMNKLTPFTGNQTKIRQFLQRLPERPGHEPRYLQHRPTEDRIHPILHKRWRSRQLEGVLFRYSRRPEHRDAQLPYLIHVPSGCTKSILSC
jgi:hypothetical protein